MTKCDLSLLDDRSQIQTYQTEFKDFIKIHVFGRCKLDDKCNKTDYSIADCHTHDFDQQYIKQRNDIVHREGISSAPTIRKGQLQSNLRFGNGKTGRINKSR